MAQTGEVMNPQNKIVWTDEKLKIIRDLYPTTPCCDIADIVGCSDCTVLNKAKEIGLKRDKSFKTSNFMGRYTHRHGKYNIYPKRNYERNRNEQQSTARTEDA